MTEVDVATITLTSDDGTVLEGDVLTPADARGVAVVCHPHPRYGGTRRDMVVAGLSRGLVDAGHKVLRFDFRGAGGSSGSHGGGGPERTDLLAAIDEVADDDLPLTIAGYSFGADIALSVTDDRAVRWLVAAPPLAVFPADEFVAGPDPRPVHIIVGGHDDVASADRIENVSTGWGATHITVIERADHFFSGAAGRIAEIAAEVAQRR